METHATTQQHAPLMSMAVEEDVGEDVEPDVYVVVGEAVVKGTPVDGRPVDATGEGDIGSTGSELLSPREYKEKASSPPVRGRVVARKNTNEGDSERCKSEAAQSRWHTKYRMPWNKIHT